MSEVSLPNLNQLFSDAWTITKSRFWQTMLLWLVQVLIIGLLAGGLIFALFSANVGNIADLNSSIFSLESSGEVATAHSLLVGLVVIMAALIVVSAVAGSLFQAATIALIASEEKIGVSAALKLGWRKFLPVILVGLLLMLIVFGGMFLFLLPGFIFTILFTFPLYEIVLHDASPLQALKNSAGMVKRYFWPVTGRIFLLIIFGAGINMISGGLVEENFLLWLILPVTQAIFTVFSIAYMTVLYRQLRSVAQGSTMSLTATAIISGLGWLGLVLLISFLLQNL